ncbi:MAG: hypothetical protein EOO89_25925, partial [Pedobacter sp.]
MKLTFICGSAEIGKDGVGDYTRRLGIEMVNQGHQVLIVAVNDNVTEEQSEKIPVSNAQEIEVIRLSSSVSWKDRIGVLELILNDFRPDWVSLQYVPYSFNVKGIPYQFVKHLKSLSIEEYWHIMFHETWLGLSSLSPLKHKLVGYFQRKVAQLLVKTLKPQKISTSNRLYQMALEKANIKSEILPLFSNIPVAEQLVASAVNSTPVNSLNGSAVESASADSAVNSVIVNSAPVNSYIGSEVESATMNSASLNAVSVTLASSFQTKIFQQLEINPSERDAYLILGIFGSLHQEYDFQKVINEELTKATAMNKKLVFLSFGRMGNVAEFDRLAALFSSKVKFIRLGELPEEEVSYTLQILDLAISCTPFEHIGKSGVYAAMRLHNVKVLLPFSDPIPELETEIRKYNDYLHSRPVQK